MSTPTPNEVSPPRNFPARLILILSTLGGTAVCLIMALGVLALFLLSRPTGEEPHSSATPPAEVVLADSTQPTPTQTVQPTLPPAFQITASSPPPTSTPLPATPTTSNAPPAPAAVADAGVADGCPHPADWEAHQVEPGETLFAYVLGALNVGTTITTDDVRSANCLTSDLLQVGQVLYLPAEAAENAPSSEPAGVSAAVAASAGPRTPNCDPACTISLRPGLRMEQIAAAIDSVPVGFWGADFLAAVGPSAAVVGYDFLASRPPGNSLEGFLFPGTYQLSNVTTAADFRDMQLAAFAANLPGDAGGAAASRGLTLYQAVTLASIVQREAYAPSEQVLISSVFHNRLASGIQLGATVTLQYALGSPADWWPRIRGGQVNTASPYNTNLNAGLPPSPIDNPGADAIRAALYPPETGYLFFTGNCHGSGNLYAATYDEHLANVNACN